MINDFAATLAHAHEKIAEYRAIANSTSGTVFLKIGEVQADNTASITYMAQRHDNIAEVVFYSLENAIEYIGIHL